MKKIEVSKGKNENFKKFKDFYCWWMLLEIDFRYSLRKQSFLSFSSGTGFTTGFFSFFSKEASCAFFWEIWMNFPFFRHWIYWKYWNYWILWDFFIFIDFLKFSVFFEFFQIFWFFLIFSSFSIFIDFSVFLDFCGLNRIFRFFHVFFVF